MPGGGPFKLESGQPTDDSELAMCLLDGIIDSNEDGASGVLDINKIALRYKQWLQSEPFDKGITTTNALSAIQDGNPARSAKEASTEHN